MEEKYNRKKLSFIKFVLWFTLLSTLGVGGGIFFLLLGLVPIEQLYTDRGLSQYKIDSAMKYYVIGWVLFGFLVSYLYYRFIVKKEYWKRAIILVSCSIFLCIAGLYYFMNTGSGLVQTSQGVVDEGERFTFGPFPEKDDMEQLKLEGYDGIITLLSPTLPIEKPLLDKEKKNAKESGLELHSLPMLPWVGDNSNSIKKAKELITKDGKRYYVHCYLGRHRVDVIKQVINEELDNAYEVMFLQPTTFERGSLYYFEREKILIGPYPTEEEWFTRVKRGEVEEVVSLLQSNSTKWIDQEKKVTAEMNIKFTSMPINNDPTIAEIKNVADYINTLDHKVFIHSFLGSPDIEMLEAYISWDKTLEGTKGLVLSGSQYRLVGQKLIIGYQPTTADQERLKQMGIEQFITVNDASLLNQYQQIKQIKDQKKLTYLIVNNEETLNSLDQIANGQLYGTNKGKKLLKEIMLANGTFMPHERNLAIGPILNPDEYDSFALKNGIAQIIFLYSSSITSKEKKEALERLAAERGIPFYTIPMYEGYEKELLPLIENENGFNYLMVEPQLIQEVHSFIKQF